LRSATPAAFHFAWRAGVADLKIDVSSTYLADGQVAHAHATRTLRRRVREVHGGWLVSYEQGSIATDDTSGLPPGAMLRGLTLPLARGLLSVPDFGVSPQGDFLRAIRPVAFSTWLQNAALGIMHAGAHRHLTSAERNEVEKVLSDRTVVARAQEDHDFETAAWIGATLEQGAWHTIQAELMLPGIPYAAVQHDIELAYTHDVPCAPGSPQACVEIVVHAAPHPDALDDLLEGMRTLGRKPGLWSATYVRVVIDPKSLMPYVLDVRRHWHLTRRQSWSDRESGMEQVVTTFSYPQAANEQSPGGEAPVSREDGRTGTSTVVRAQAEIALPSGQE
jgi:hypothetical protein